MGIDEINKEIERAETATNADKELSVLFNICFSTDAGKKVMEALSTILNDIILDPAHPKPVQLGFYREGQNSVVRMIQKRVQIGEAIISNQNK